MASVTGLALIMIWWMPASHSAEHLTRLHMAITTHHLQRYCSHDQPPHATLRYFVCCMATRRPAPHTTTVKARRLPED